MYQRWMRNGNDSVKVQDFLESLGLDFERQASDTILIFNEKDELIGTGSMDEGVLKCIAVLPDYHGGGFLGTILTALINRSHEKGYHHLFIYTKPKNEKLFKPFGFYPIASTSSIILMENKKQGIQSFVRSLEGQRRGIVGSIVMNANPFTLGHRYLVEMALEQVDELQLFVLSSKKSIVPFDVRLRLVKEGCADLNKVCIHPTNNYLVSAATFPSYFLPKETIAEANAALDLKIFIDYFAGELKISNRFLGTEPFSPITDSYNKEILKTLPNHGIQVTVLQRKDSGGEAISASRVRAIMKDGNVENVRLLVPQTTYDYLSSKEGLSLFMKA